MLHQVGIAVIGKAAGERVEEMESVLHLPEQQATGIGGDLAPVKAGNDFPREPRSWKSSSGVLHWVIAAGPPGLDERSARYSLDGNSAALAQVHW
jgi:hypothetical protein